MRALSTWSYLVKGEGQNFVGTKELEAADIRKLE